MGRLVNFPSPSSIHQRKPPCLNPNNTFVLLARFRLSPHDYLVLVNLTRKSPRRTPTELTSHLEVRHLVYRPLPGVVRLTRAGWAVLAACRLLGIDERRSPRSAAVQAALYPAG